MKRLYQKLLLMILLAPTTCFSLHAVLDHVHHAMRWELSSRTIYVWGDSRTRRGLDLAMLRRHTRRPVLSFAHDGAGVYDLWVFTRRVPPQSDVLLGLSLPILRGKRRYNRSGLSLVALFEWLRAGHPWRTIKPLLLENHDPLHTVAHTDSQPFPTQAAMDRTLIPIYRKYTIDKATYGKRPLPASYTRNVRLYRRAIHSLHARGCRVTLLVFPTAPITQKLAKRSIYGDYLLRFKDLVQRQEAQLLASIPLPKQPNMMYDISHLNARGRTLVTRYIIQHIFPK